MISGIDFEKRRENCCCGLGRKKREYRENNRRTSFGKNIKIKGKIRPFNEIKELKGAV